MTVPTRWELLSYAINITQPSLTHAHVDPTFTLSLKDKDGKTEFDQLQQFAAEGWELVSVTPIATASATNQTFLLLYTFKRPIA